MKGGKKERKIKEDIEKNVDRLSIKHR